MNYLDWMAHSLSGPEYGLRAACLAFMASYSYTRSFDGCEGDAQGSIMHFGRWYSFKAGCSSFWRWLYKRKGD